MESWNDELRVCPKCKAAVRMAEEPRAECPKCGAAVWFFNYKPLPPSPEIPPPKPDGLWNHPTTTLLLGATAIFGLVALISVAIGGVVAAASSLAAIGFAIFGFVRHAEARGIEQQTENAARLAKYAELSRNRLKDAVLRYNHLLATGDSRIEQYHRDIYLRAVREREQAEAIREEAEREREAVRSVENRIYAMAERLVQDHLKWTAAKLRPDPENYQKRKFDLEKAFDFVEAVGYSPPPTIRKDALAKLKADYQRVVREANAKEEQKRINQRMREEEKLRREREQAVKEAEERERELQRRLEESLREMQADLRSHTDASNAEVDELRRQLAEAHANAERAKSMAQLTKAGHVYVLSNVGSFGEDVFKVGMTRRLEPDERVKELGDASVPFPFDVHAMISCENAPALESTLHRELTRYRVNRVNLRKEFFRVDLEIILGVVRRSHGEIEYVAEPEALEYRDSMQTTPDEVVELDKELAEIGVSAGDSDE